LDHVVRAAHAGLPYVYLGYWIDGCRRMEYKTRFQPMEALGPDGWSLYHDDDVEPITAPSLDQVKLLPV
jgi:leucyl-tRNA---protein transferase